MMKEFDEHMKYLAADPIGRHTGKILNTFAAIIDNLIL